MTQTKGRCLCGAVTFEFEGPVNWSSYCHCESCRRNTSSPITAFFSVPRSAYRFTSETPKVYESSPGVFRLFCGNCGSPVAYDAPKYYPDEIHFYNAALEDPAAIAPTEHVFHREKLPWFGMDDGLPVREGSADGED